MDGIDLKVWRLTKIKTRKKLNTTASLTYPPTPLESNKTTRPPASQSASVACKIQKIQNKKAKHIHPINRISDKSTHLLERNRTTNSIARHSGCVARKNSIAYLHPSYDFLIYLPTYQPIHPTESDRTNNKPRCFGGLQKI
jgi:hypothetical protein